MARSGWLHAQGRASGNPRSTRVISLRRSQVSDCDSGRSSKEPKFIR